ncbi:hypothetical protein ABB37_01198 [Leptomonas pyrrhocoris]|uniref:Uncharacterized protein n=1 Tax=Leptomonas pyrrhocoris TaxID=157538 RepID=A0A0N0DZ01_LEPPY|nr:hypothetical protein ABB37_01198 [Leptomonas pyrrhocoris]KPA84691.1 hypothetical protein ABB37_01198 [Leptomonas pyrrhocoris]|eukprot:XP_015663130.1 hypothetical protein ABB37_01198 [Leptomonas pyrrhocoris]
MAAYTDLEFTCGESMHGGRFFLGLLLILTTIVLPLVAMGLRSRSVFRRRDIRPPSPFQ